MRPVEKGTAPRVYGKYQDAGPDLQACLGDYCSYCERQIETHLAVEHIQPKCLEPALERSWSNLLLGCVNCNSCKGCKPISIPDYFWPDIDNTLRAFQYARGGLIQPDPTLTPSQQTKAKATISLVGLDCIPGTTRPPRINDKRWLRRQQTWQLAEKYRQDLLANDTSVVRELIVDLALAKGMFSIWWTVFAGDIDMRRRFREAFPGSHCASFDSNEDLLPRAGGQL